MVKLHTTRLMRPGEVVLWRGGRIVWEGAVGAALYGLAFDAITISMDDGARLSGELTPERVLKTLADWWE